MSLQAEVVLFAIQAAIRLEGQVRKAQIEAIKKTSLTLLVPFAGKIDEKSAGRYFRNDGRRFYESDARIRELVDKEGRRELKDKEEKKELRNLYLTRRNYLDNLSRFEGANLPPENIFALMHVKQWEDANDPTLSPIQRIVGTLVDIGVDYYRSNAHLIHKNATHGRLVSSFLEALDEIDFAEAPLETIASEMMVATIQTLDATSDLMKSDTASQQLVKAVAKGVLTDVTNHVKANKGNLLEQEKAREWGQVVFRSVLQTTGETVFANPSSFFNTGDAANEAITTIGNSFLNILLTDVTANGKKIDLGAFLSKDALDKMTRSAVGVLAAHPEWYHLQNDGLNNVLKALVQQVANYPDQIGLAMLPDLANLLLNQTAGNLQLIYKGDPTKVSNNLLLMSSKIVLDILQSSVPQEAGKPWQPIFTKAQTLDLVDTVFQAVIEQPEWILEKTNNKPILHTALSTAIQSLNGIPISQLNNQARLNVVHSVIIAVGSRREFLDTLAVGNEQKELLGVAMDMLVDLAVGQGASAASKWAILKADGFEMLVGAALQRIAIEGPALEVVNLVHQYLDGELNVMIAGQSFDIDNIVDQLLSTKSLDELLQTSTNIATSIAAQVVASNPDILKIKNDGLTLIIQTLAAALEEQDDIWCANLLPDLAQLVLTTTAQNLDTIYGNNLNDPTKNILITATKTVLDCLTNGGGITGNSGTIAFSKDQVLDLIDAVVQQVVVNTDWITSKINNQPLLKATLNAAISALDGVSVTALNAQARMNVLHAAIGAVSTRREFLDKIKIDGSQKELLNVALDMVFGLAMGDMTTANAKWAILSTDGFDILVDAVLQRIAKEGPAIEVIKYVELYLEGELEVMLLGQAISVDDIVDSLLSAESLDDLLQSSKNIVLSIAATAIAENPSILKIKHEGVQLIVKTLMQELATHNDTWNVSLLPDLANLVLQTTADNLDLIYGNKFDEPTKNLLITATKTVLDTLSSGDNAAGSSGQIAFSKEQMFELLDFALDQVMQQPQWITLLTNGKPMLEAAILAGLEAFDGVALSQVNQDTRVQILESVVIAVAKRKELLDLIPVDGKDIQTATFVVAMVLDIVNATPSAMPDLDAAARASIQWILSNNDIMDELVDAALMRVAQEGTSQQVLDWTKQLIVEEVRKIAKGEPYSLEDLIHKLLLPESLELLLNLPPIDADLV